LRARHQLDDRQPGLESGFDGRRRPRGRIKIRGRERLYFTGQVRAWRSIIVSS